MLNPGDHPSLTCHIQERNDAKLLNRTYYPVDLIIQMNLPPLGKPKIETGISLNHHSYSLNDVSNYAMCQNHS